MDFFSRPIPLFLEKYLGKPDYRTCKWFLLTSPASFITIILVYWATLYNLHRFMRSRNPFSLRKVLVIYNAAQVLYSFFIFKEVVIAAYKSNYSLACARLDNNLNPLTKRMINAVYYFYLSKIFDLMDTVFFVLRKKEQQLSFLHLYHHSSMIFNWYLALLFLPGGQTFFSVVCNSYVHCVMYTYYMLSAMGPRMQKYLWWKKYLTQLQLIQFATLIVHLFYGLTNKCEQPIWLLWYTVCYLFSLLSLFGRFYYFKYRNMKNQRKRTNIFHMQAPAGGDNKRS